jgi:hypothetical protein
LPSGSVIGERGTELDDAVDLLVAGAVGRAEVEVQPVLHGLALRHPDEEDVRTGSDHGELGVVGVVGLVRIVGVTVEDLLPEQPDDVRVVAVEREIADHAGHGVLLMKSPRRADVSQRRVAGAV